MAELTCIVVTPEETAFEERTSFVALPLFDGEIGIALNHAPMIGRLGYGELRFRDDAGKLRRYYIDGGFVQVADNVVSVLTSRAVPAEELVKAELQDQLHMILSQPVHSPDEFAVRDRAILQTRAQLRLIGSA